MASLSFLSLLLSGISAKAADTSPPTGGGGSLSFLDVPSPIVVPAAVACNGSKNSFYHWTSRKCVEIDESDSLMPSFEPCPDGSVQDGYDCVGIIQQPPREVCKKSYFPSVSGEYECSKSAIYDAEVEDTDAEPTCPQGYLMRRVIGDQVGPYGVECVKTTEVNSMFDDGDGGQVCQEGATQVDGSDEPVCLLEVTTKAEYPQPTGCREGDVVSANLGGQVCLSVELGLAQSECQRPFMEAERGADGQPSLCQAKYVAATGASCPDGYTLQGREGSSKVECQRLVFKEPTYHCLGLEGSSLESEIIDAGMPTEIVRYTCRFDFDEDAWRPSEETVESRRQKADYRKGERRERIGLKPAK